MGHCGMSYLQYNRYPMLNDSASAIKLFTGQLKLLPPNRSPSSQDANAVLLCSTSMLREIDTSNRQIKKPCG